MRWLVLVVLVSFLALACHSAQPYPKELAYFPSACEPFPPCTPSMLTVGA